MGQTLSHGVYLPNEGERNCYAGLASNWQILNTAVGAIAEKAPLVHTHTVSQITDFPVYGTTAGTICEGNDSRLSDARTPVAHTHGKADITDLFNSNFIPSANNSYNLGSSSYQWNNLYAKNYYYNGVAWGLDKANVWTADQTIASSRFLRVYGYRFQIKNDLMVLGTVPSSNQWTGMQFVDKNNTAISEIIQSFQSNGNSVYQINVFPNEANSEKRSVIAYTYNSANNNNALVLTSNLLPSSNNTYDLGSSNQKWKTLNGINPGALSLPSGGTTENTDWFNVAGDILPTGGNATSFSRETANYFTPAKDGWLALAVKNCSEISVWCESLKYGISIVVPNASVNRQTVIPVVAGKSYQILITGNSWTSARLIMPQGNV